MNNKPIAIVDVDNILHPFHEHLYKLLKEIDVNVPNWKKWNIWDFYQNYITKNSFYKICDYLHKKQESLTPFTDAKKLLDILYQNYYIIIASHRQKTNKIHLINWLDKYKLKYDEVYCGTNKTQLFNDDVVLVIDDSPLVLQVAIDQKMNWCGLLYPWNKKIDKQYKNRLFENLKELIKYVEKEI